jgi:outer membrane beta-barrel protein
VLGALVLSLVGSSGATLGNGALAAVAALGSGAISCSAALLGATALATAALAPNTARAATDDDEYNFDWLDKDKKIYVLQNRKFLKSNHLVFSAMTGVEHSSPYRSSYSVGGRVAYYAAEWLGFEGLYSKVFNSENNIFKALKQSAPTAKPNVRQINSEMGLLVHYVPWYAKINVFNAILHFDWYFSGGAGQIATEVNTAANNATPVYVQQDETAFFLGTGHQYHVTRRLNVRLDFTSTFYRAPLVGVSGAKTWFSNYAFTAGLGFKL